jgi:mono/diheme cytochrome c family protein
MRRLAFFLGIALLLAGCGGGGPRVVSPTAETVIGTLPSTTTTAAPTGNAANGATLFKSQGCTGCHTFTPAGSKATIGPDLDKLAQYAKVAKMPLADFTHESIQNPSSYLEPGYQNIMPNFGQTLKPQQISDLVAYLTNG